MKTFKELRSEITEASAALPAPSSTSIAKKAKFSVGKAKAPINMSKFPDTTPSPRATVADVAKSALRAGGRLAVRAAPQAAAGAVGLAAGEVARKGLDVVGPGASNDKSTGNISKANAKSSGDGVKFKGDVPTIPSDKKSVEPQRKISQPELGGMLRGEPQKLNLPKPEVRNIGQTTTGGSTKPAPIASRTTAPIASRTTAPKPASIEKKSLPTAVTKKPTPPSSSVDLDDLRASVQRMRAATSDLTKKTGEWKSLQKPQQSSSLHSQMKDVASSEPTVGRQAFPSSAKYPNQSVFSKVVGK